MEKNTNKSSIAFGEICKVANVIRKERGVSQKEAYALAKAQLEGASKNLVISLIEFKSRLAKGYVKFAYKNKSGKVEKVQGTTNPDLFSKTHRIYGRSTSKDNNVIVFYDRAHGQFRPCKIEDVVELF